MEVQCPQCQSKFHLPDAVVRPNVKLRCSVCQHVFRYEGAPAQEAPIQAPAQAPAQAATPAQAPVQAAAAEPAMEGGGENLDDFSLDNLPGSTSGSKGTSDSGKKKSKLIISILVVLLCIGGGAGAWWYMNMQKGENTEAAAEIPKSVEFMTMRNVRQYYVKNEKIGDIFVVEGKIINEFPEPKELIEVEAAIYAADKTVLMSKEQLAGTALSLFQLQVLGEEELESFLHNEIEILTKNTNVPSGGEVPFMVLFYNPPPEVAEFGVKILTAKDVKKEAD